MWLKLNPVVKHGYKNISKTWIAFDQFDYVLRANHYVHRNESWQIRQKKIADIEN